MGKTLRRLLSIGQNLMGLLPEAVKEFEARGQSKDDVDAYVQKHADYIGQMVLYQSKMRADEKKLFPQLVAFCDKTYP